MQSPFAYCHSQLDSKNAFAIDPARDIRPCGIRFTMPIPNASPDSPSEIPEALDHRLMERLHAGDRDAATEIYVRYADRLLGVAERNTPADLRPRFDPEDVVQSVFRTFFRRAESGAYAVPEGQELWKLFLVISLNKIRRLGNFHRSAKRSVSKTSALHPDSDEDRQDAHDSVRLLELTIEELLAQCPEHARQMVRLRIEGCDVAEIAERTSRSKRSVERVLQHFRTLLTGELSGARLSSEGGQP
jgi:RNA polymerase sigma-70 factor (ECF subfamily)